MATDNMKNDSTDIKPFKLSDLEEMTLDNLSNEDLFLVSDAIDNNKSGGGSYISKKLKFETVADCITKAVYDPLAKQISGVKPLAEEALKVATAAQLAATDALNGVKSEAEARQKDVNALNTSIKSTEEKIAKAQAAADNAGKIAEDAKNAVTAVQAAVVKAQAAADAAVAKVDLETSRAQGAEADINANIANLNGAIAKTLQQVDEVKTHLEDVKKNVETLSNRTSDVESSVKDAKDLAEAAKAEAASAAEQVAAETTRAKDAENDIASKTTALEEMLGDYPEVKAQVSTNKANIDAIGARTSVVEDKVNNVESNVKTVEDKANESLAIATAAQAKADEVEAELDNLSEAAVIHTDGIIRAGYMFNDETYGLSVENTDCSVAIAQKLHIQAGEANQLSVCNVAWPWKPGTENLVLATTDDISSEISTRFKKVTESEWSTISVDADDSTFYFIVD